MIKSLILLESIFPTIATLFARNLWVEHPHVEIWEENVRWVESWFWGQLKTFLKDNLKNLERTNKLSSQCLPTLITNSLLPKVLSHKTRLRGQNLKNSIGKHTSTKKDKFVFQTGNYLPFFSEKYHQKYTERFEKLKKLIRFDGLPRIGQGDLGYLLFHPEITFSLVI